MRVYRIYFTTFDKEKYVDILNYLKERYNEIKSIESSVVPEFKFIEIRGESVDPNALKEELEKKFKLKFKVDVVDIVLPSRKS